ncbi:MAG: hypothetical protein EOO15_03930 [Chitinophagaceae bacterium]|nr:MAG: hypothetical protein EOO15_03930 [Chitinophagaceae bacterium]
MASINFPAVRSIAQDQLGVSRHDVVQLLASLGNCSVNELPPALLHSLDVVGLFSKSRQRSAMAQAMEAATLALSTNQL